MESASGLRRLSGLSLEDVFRGFWVEGPRAGFLGRGASEGDRTTFLVGFQGFGHMQLLFFFGGGGREGLQMQV